MMAFGIYVIDFIDDRLDPLGFALLTAAGCLAAALAAMNLRCGQTFFGNVVHSTGIALFIYYVLDASLFFRHSLYLLDGLLRLPLVLTLVTSFAAAGAWLGNRWPEAFRRLPARTWAIFKVTCFIAGVPVVTLLLAAGPMALWLIVEDTAKALRQSQSNQEPKPPARQQVPPCARTYALKEGDTLQTIAAEQLGSAARWEDIYVLNSSLFDELNVKDSIPAGTVIYIPDRCPVAD